MSKRKGLTIRQEERINGLLIVAPAFILLTIFVLVPLALSLYRSLFYYESGPAESYFVGFQNYVQILQNEVFVKSLLNVVILTSCVVLLQVIGAYIFANILVRTKNRFSTFVRTIIYLPYLFSGVVVGCIFTLLTTYNGGFINGMIGLWNDFLYNIGVNHEVEAISFQMDTFWAYISIIIPTIWVGGGYTTLVFYSGLINVPKEILEAASVDGAGTMRKHFSIILPSLRSYIVLVIVTLITGNLQMFEIPMIMTNGMPLNATMTPVLYLTHLRANGNVAQSEVIAASVLIMLVVGALNAVVFGISNAKGKEDR